jgi:hydroxymethylpyrimidine/phosphomethylpyrimidine kinase
VSDGARSGVHGTSVLTALTAQNTRGVRAVAEVEPRFVAEQLAAVLDDLDVAAAKTGMVARAAVVESIVDGLRACPVPHLVVDPVMMATSGDALLDPEGVRALRMLLLPLATLVTPNLGEAEALTGRSISSPADMRDAARALVDLGAGAALVTGGHLRNGGRDAVDVLWDGGGSREFSARRIAARSTHGTGCTLSAAIAAGLAAGRDLPEAIARAKGYVTRAIESARAIGQGAELLNHFVSPDETPRTRSGR